MLAGAKPLTMRNTIDGGAGLKTNGTRGHEMRYQATGTKGERSHAVIAGMCQVTGLTCIMNLPIT